ncbi:hypothetical protein AQI88_24890 [Streptomyces cellostaticus]|uniref:Major facilitator superfamily (MFS) profile domain-containing protein n=1 Tax=Streptomyces cellostaticus TaxID=67285 RepID=A0A101NI13_9ACTN|nr:MFS transporter [Streptomyces cellostaticus]KUM93656.1 hypothetical protein AQI88_24890 [Streptomyces cellostaticus]GHI07548.1 MFS transporter [Streptomyces cellostaticus]
MTAMRALFPALPRKAWSVLGADALSAVGSGLTLPFLVLYLHTIRGFGLATASLAVAAVAVAGLAGNPLGGALSDRAGPRTALIAGLTIAGVGSAGLTVVTHPWQAFAAAGLSGLGLAVAWPAQDSLLARLVRPGQRSSVFAVRHATMNLGLAAGALLAALLVDTSRPGTFIVLYLLDAASFLAAIPIVLGVKAPQAGPATEKAPDTGESTTERTGYRQVLRDPLLRQLWLLTALLITVGYGQFNAALPAYATGQGGISARELSIVFAANTLTVVLAQLLTLRLLSGRRRTRGIMVLCGMWAVTWLLTLLGGATEAFAVGLFVGAAVVFGLGETLLSSTVPALVNDIAPEHLRGRYNGASTLAYTTGFALGPLLAGFTLARGLAPALFAGLVTACALGALLAHRLERRLPPTANIVDAPVAGAAAPAVPSADPADVAP